MLVTGAGGPSGVSILRALEASPVTLLAGDIDPYGAGLYIVDAGQRWILRRARRPALRRRPAGAAAGASGGRRGPDRRQRAAAAGARRERVRGTPA